MKILQSQRGRRCMLAIICLHFFAVAPVSAYAGSSLELYVAAMPRPGIAQGCEMYFFAKTAGDPWKKVTAPVQLNWRGGGVLLNPEASPVEYSIKEQCFRLVLDGRILVGGAVISEHSARRLDFHVLAESSKKAGGPPVLMLQERWPVKATPKVADRAVEQLRKAFP
jgi:hypothetical protein